MKAKYIYIGLGVLAVGGIAYYFITKDKAEDLTEAGKVDTAKTTVTAPKGTATTLVKKMALPKEMVISKAPVSTGRG